MGEPKGTPEIHPQVLPFFPDYDYRSPAGDRKVLCDYSNPQNAVGHQQRAFSIWWALKMCGPLDLGLDIGSCRGMTPFCMHVDKFGRGEAHPHYSGTHPVWADVVSDMNDLCMFPKNGFPLVVSNHSLEHADVSRYLPSEVPRCPEVSVHRDAASAERKAWIAAYPRWRSAYDQGVVRMLREEWIRVLRPGGVLAMVVPDRAFSDVLAVDGDHRHAWDHSDFDARILRHLLDLVEIEEWNTFQNKFSFNVVLRRR